MKTMRIKSIAIDRKTQIKIMCGLAVFFVLMNILNKAIYNTEELTAKGIASGILFGLASAFTYMALIIIIDRPFLGLEVLILNHVSTVGGYLIIGDSQESVQESVIWALLIVLILLTNAVYRLANGKKEKLIEVKRTILKVSLPFKIMLYSSMLTVIFILEKTERFEIFHNAWYKFYGAVVVLLPIYFMFGIMTTSIIAYDLFTVKILIEIISFVLVTDKSNFNLIMMLEIIAEIIIAVYWYLIYCLKTQTDNEQKQEIKDKARKEK